MAFPVGWARKCALVIDYTKVLENLTSFPVLLTSANVPAEMITSGGANACKSDGSDIRITTDAAGTTECPLEVVVCTLNANPALSAIQIYTKIPSVSSSVNTTFYIWYKNASASAYGVTDTYGRNNVWTDFAAVWHLNVVTAGSATVVDSSGNLGTNGTPSTGTGTGSSNPLIPNNVYAAYDAVGEKIVMPADTDLLLTNLITAGHGCAFESILYPTVDWDDLVTGYDRRKIFIGGQGSGSGQNLSWGCFPDSQGGGGQAGHYKRIVLEYKISATPTFESISSQTYRDSGDVWCANEWQYYGLRIRNTSDKKYQYAIYANGGWKSENELSYTSTPVAPNTRVDDYLGNHGTYLIESPAFNQGETRISKVERTVNWMKTTYNTVVGAATFITEGTPVAAGIIYERDIQAGVNRGINRGINSIQ